MTCVSLAAISLFAVGCVKSHIDRNLRDVVIRIEPDSVALERTPDLIRFTVNVVVRNDRPTPLYWAGCGPNAQQEINGHWETVWSPICGSVGRSTIAPGDSVMFPFSAAAFPRRQIEPHLDPKATAGRYRLQLGTVYSRLPDYGMVYRGPAPPPAKVIGTLTSPIFIVYER